MPKYVSQRLADELARLADESIEREARGELTHVVREDGSLALVSFEEGVAERETLTDTDVSSPAAPEGEGESC